MWLVREKLHKDVSFEQRVKNMRQKRWRDRVAKPATDPDETLNMMPTDGTETL